VRERTVRGEGVHQRQTRGRPVGHRDGDRAVQFDDRTGRQADELPVQTNDLRPIGRRRVGRLSVDRRDRRLHLVDARTAAAQRPVEQRERLGDLATVPGRAVLILQRDQVSVAVHTRGPARVVQQHQRE
jgi:hypothetical protein